MKRNRRIISSQTVLVALSAILLLGASRVSAHCDGLDGPVVKAARKALETGSVNHVLVWVQAEDEAEIRKAFEKTLEVRKLSPEARELADMYFFETLVRIHRAGEGAPYTGLKPAGRDLGPAIPAADRALEEGSAEPLLKLLSDTVQEGVRKNFREVIDRKDFNREDVAAGREYVKAYVEFIHFVERTYEAAESPAHGHYKESEDHPAAEEVGMKGEGHVVASSQKTKGGQTMKFRIPQPLKAEHEELHEELARATRAGGRIGEMAKAVARVMHSHFEKEEEYAMPPLGLLTPLAEGEVTPEMKDVLVMTDRLKRDLPEMLSEHKAIVESLEKLSEAAKKENQPEYSHFAEKLILHARTEEEVLYPASIVIGEYLKLKLGTGE